MNLNDEYYGLTQDDRFYEKLINLADNAGLDAAELLNSWYWEGDWVFISANIKGAMNDLFTNTFGPEYDHCIMHDVLRDLENASNVYVND